ncbi:hypothetical protein Q5H93_07775 [Hymenobacter sp. ASUV-10]|uniref:Outer membrane protein beta-barrel domain-containing protein n=1 Tax=Hymenobacter aranciens TaxID=3063996 RepID=A0ABT9B8M6_9BACT|nr:hypothetical protein [Hymenobacter sp. ASUV-10]MDO7874627.1 hypothetical protein [Hymenobacter sp. ASUV-10]
MWSDKELDDAFRRLAPPEPEAEPFPLDAWLRLEQQLDKTAMEREFRRRLWRFFAAEMLVVAVGALLWLAWPVRQRAVAVGGGVAASPAARVAGANSPTTGARAAAPGWQQKPGVRSSGAVASGAIDDAGAAAVASAPASPSDNNSIEATNAGAGLARAATGGNTHSASSGAAGHAGHAATTAGTASDSAVSAGRSPGGLVAAGLAAAERQQAKAARIPGGREPSAAARPKMTAYTAARAKAPRTAGSRTGRASTTLHSKHFAANTSTTRATNGSHGKQKALTSSRFQSAASRPADATLTQLAAIAPAPGNAASVPTVADATGSLTAAATELAELQPRPVALQTDSATALPAPLAALPFTTAPLPEPFRQPRLYLGLLAAPDVSTVKMADYQAPTPNLGVLLEYRLTTRLRVNTGLLHSTKQYRARRQDYDWSYYPRGATGTFEWVDGRCTILDVPVNLRYDVLARPRYQVFGSAGLSSLFMQHENYAYDYEYYGRLYRWESSFTNENQHWFSVLNLSAGYEHNLSQHWRLQVEPYVKMPLGGVGAGKVRLMSGGVFFGVKYGL